MGTRPNLDSYFGRAFDQGFGRSLWFVAGADVERLARQDLDILARGTLTCRAGVGLACAYAGMLPGTRSSGWAGLPVPVLTSTVLSRPEGVSVIISRWLEHLSADRRLPTRRALGITLAPRIA